MTHLWRPLFDRAVLCDGCACLRGPLGCPLLPSTVTVIISLSFTSGRLIHLSDFLKPMWNFRLEVRILCKPLYAYQCQPITSKCSQYNGLDT